MNQRGSLSTEFALLVPALVLLFSVAVGGARAWMARSTVEQMAGAAARGASLERTVNAAERSAKALATAQARYSNLRCESLGIEVDASILDRAVGTAGSIEVVARCEVPLADILVPGWPGSLPVSVSASAIVDSYRGRK